MRAEVGKPGTNWTQVTPAHRKKISAIVNHYAKAKHPFAQCYRDNLHRFGPRTAQVCAVVKDMGRRSTKWRKGGKHQLSATATTIDLSHIDQGAVVSDLVSFADELIEAEKR